MVFIIYMHVLCYIGSFVCDGSGSGHLNAFFYISNKSTKEICKRLDTFHIGCTQYIRLQLNFAWKPNRSTDCILICTAELSSKRPLYESDGKSVDNILLWQTRSLSLALFLCTYFIQSLLFLLQASTSVWYTLVYLRFPPQKRKSE